MMATPEQLALLGEDVVVTGPLDIWQGRAIALAEDPVILIEQQDGRRMMLPLAWAKPHIAEAQLLEQLPDWLDPGEAYALAEKDYSTHRSLLCLEGSNCKLWRARNLAYARYTKCLHPEAIAAYRRWARNADR